MSTDLELANISTTFPEVPDITANTPNITGLDFNPATRKLKVTGANFVPSGQSAGSFEFRVWLTPRAEQMTVRSDRDYYSSYCRGFLAYGCGGGAPPLINVGAPLTPG